MLTGCIEILVEPGLILVLLLLLLLVLSLVGVVLAVVVRGGLRGGGGGGRGRVSVRRHVDVRVGVVRAVSILHRSGWPGGHCHGRERDRERKKEKKEIGGVSGGHKRCTLGMQCLILQ